MDALIYVGMIPDLCTHRWDVGVVGVRLGYNVVGLHGRHTPNHLTRQVDSATLSYQRTKQTETHWHAHTRTRTKTNYEVFDCAVAEALAGPYVS
jgi:hypothetical protein